MNLRSHPRPSRRLWIAGSGDFCRRAGAVFLCALLALAMGALLLRTPPASAAGGFEWERQVVSNYGVSALDESHVWVVGEIATILFGHPQTVDITASASPAGAGEVTGEGTFQYRQPVTLTVSANPGYRFVRWSEGGAEVSTANPYLFNAQGDRALAAEFEEQGPATGTVWYLAEGATAGDFDTWVLVMNPGEERAQVRLTFMTESGPVPGPEVYIEPERRQSFHLDAFVTSYDVFTLVTSLNGVPVVAERAMYDDARTWAQDSVGCSP